MHFPVIVVGEDIHEILVPYGPDADEYPEYDYYTIGGRWDGFFKAKGVPYLVNSVEKRDLDFNYYKSDPNKLGEIFDSVSDMIKDLPVHKSFNELLEELRDYGIKDSKLIRDTWKNQTRVDKILKSEFNNYYPDDFLGSKEDFINNHKNDGFYISAIVEDGTWQGLDNFEEWLEMLKEYPDDMKFTIVDCHI
jgi:hypothetical protein